MKRFISALVFLSSLISYDANAQINIGELYDKYWRAKTYEIIKPNSTVTIYSRYGNKGALDYSSSITVFKKDGTIEGFNAGGFPAPGKFSLVSSDEIFFDGDKTPTKITRLTDNELITESSDLYNPIHTNDPYNIITKIVYEAFDACAVYESLRSGDWSDATIWTCQKVPTSDSLVQINQNHKVTIPNNYIAHAKSVTQIGKLKINENSKIEFGR